MKNPTGIKLCISNKITFNKTTFEVGALWMWVQFTILLFIFTVHIHKKDSFQNSTLPPLCLFICMHACMHACVCVCVHACMRVCVQKRVCAYMHVFTHTHKHVCMSVCLHVKDLQADRKTYMQLHCTILRATEKLVGLNAMEHHSVHGTLVFSKDIICTHKLWNITSKYQYDTSIHTCTKVCC